MNHENDENCIKVLIEGLYRAKLKTIIDENEYLTAEHELSPMTVSVDETTQATRLQNCVPCSLSMLKQNFVMLVS